jgi:hypothetical protein
VTDAKARDRLIEREQDARLRLIGELQAVAYVDIGDLVQCDRDPVFDEAGSLTGYRDRVEFTPSRLLTKAERGAIKSITKHTTKNGTTLRIDTNGKLEALDKLSKILGLTQLDPPASVNTQVNVGQVNVGAGGDNALEAARRLAFDSESRPCWRGRQGASAGKWDRNGDRAKDARTKR